MSAIISDELAIVIVADQSYSSYSIFLVYQLREIGYDGKIFIVTDSMLNFRQNNISKLEITLIIQKSEAIPFQKQRHVSNFTYTKMNLAQLVPSSIRKVIYLDVDTLVFENPVLLAEEHEIDILGAVRDFRSPQLSSYIRTTGPYFNAGLLFIDVLKFKLAIKDIDLRWIKKNTSYYQDQDILNRLFENRWQELPEKWNTTLSFLGRTHQKNITPSIVHFIGSRKPWISSAGTYHMIWRREYEKFAIQFGLDPLQKSKWPLDQILRLLDLILVDNFINKIPLRIRRKLAFKLQNLFKK